MAAARTHSSTSSEQAPRGDLRRSESSRTCVGCGERVARDAVRVANARVANAREPENEASLAPLVRLVASPEREVVVDSGDGSFGRGIYVHASGDCVAKAAKSGLARSLKGVPQLGGRALTAADLQTGIVEAFDRRVEGLLGAARRTRRLEFGADAVCAAIRAGDVRLVIVASDAAAAAEKTEVRIAIREGKAISWGDKERLGTVARGDGGDVGVLGVTDSRIAAAVRDARVVMDSVQVRRMSDRSRPRGNQPTSATSASEGHEPNSRATASILDEGTASLPGPVFEGDGPGKQAEEPPLGSAE